MTAARWFVIGVAACLIAALAVSSSEPWRPFLSLAVLIPAVYALWRLLHWRRQRKRKRRDSRRRFQRSVPLYSIELYGEENPGGITLEIIVVFVLCISVAVVIWSRM